MLTTIAHGTESQSVPLVIAHGLFGSARNWGVISKRLSDTRRVVAVDMRNHGASPWTETHGYDDLAADLSEVIDSLGGTCDLLGHSMGGKAAMTVAVTHPEKIRRLIVADIAPVTYGHTQMSLVRAMREMDLTNLGSRGDADKRLSASVPDPQVRAFLLQSLDVSDASWRLNLDVLASDMDKILSFPEVRGEFGGPALFLSGATSDYVRPEHRPAIKALFPKARFVKIPGAGHWLHAEKPREFEAAVRAFLDAPAADQAS